MMVLGVVSESWEACAYLVLGLVGAIGLMALVSPRRFATLATRGNTAVEAPSPATSISRLVGLGLLAAVLLAGYWIARL
jgi:hypothetical protein